MPFNTGTTNNRRPVFSETLLMGNAGTVNGATINFVKPGENFTVFVNTAALNTVGAVTTDLEVSFDETTWATLDSSFIADFDTAVLVKAYVAATSGDFPYYRLSFDATANDAASSITYKVVVGL